MLEGLQSHLGIQRKRGVFYTTCPFTCYKEGIQRSGYRTSQNDPSTICWSVTQTLTVFQIIVGLIVLLSTFESQPFITKHLSRISHHCGNMGTTEQNHSHRRQTSLKLSSSPHFLPHTVDSAVDQMPSLGAKPKHALQMPLRPTNPAQSFSQDQHKTKT